MATPGAFLSGLEAIAQLLLPIVLIAGGIVCWDRRKLPRTREIKLVGAALGMFVVRIVVLGMLATVVGLVFRPSLWDLAQTNHFYASVNWWLGFVFGILNSTFYAAAWGILIYAAFGKGSSSTPRYEPDREIENTDSAD